MLPPPAPARALYRLTPFFLASAALLAACGGPKTTPSPHGTTSGAGGAGGSATTATTTTASGTGGMGGPGTWTMGEPFATAAPTWKQVTHPLPPAPKAWATTAGPHPTNAPWMNFVLGTGQNPVNIFPYLVKATDTGLHLSFPTPTVTPTSVVAAFTNDIALQCLELTGPQTVIGYDLLSVTLKWVTMAGSTMTAPIVRGMPYATMEYSGLTPQLATSHVITSVNGAALTPVSSDRFEITMDDGKTWILYASPAFKVDWNSSTVAAEAPYQGTLRLALKPADAAAVADLDLYRTAYPTGGDVAATVTANGDTATVDFAWKKQGTGPLLMAALPHHTDTLTSPKKSPLSYKTLRGTMTGVIGDAWSWSEPLSPIAWSAPTAIDSTKLADVKAALAADASLAPAAEDPYFYGKQIAKLGRLAVIADEIGDTTTASAIRGKMKASLDPWLTGTNKDALEYDKSWGGICSAKGLADPAADFGQGYYNDHHFHYGYHLYAAAALAKGDSAWLAARRAAIVDLARDIANPSAKDPYFTAFRTMDWFEGHSWAAGLFELGSGRNQESTSEAVNAWYGVYLFGLVSGDKNLENVGRLLLATEIRSAQRYWQIKQGSTIYADPFAANKVVGVLWGSKADYATFFGAKTEYIHGIQMIPFTPASEALLPKGWVTEEYPVVAKAVVPGTEEGWKGFVFMDHAILDREAAWAEVKTLKAYDDGNSKTNTLYWVATRPK